MTDGVANGPSYTFGPYRLLAAERLLERDGVAVQLSSRALDILVALVERAGEVVPKDDLIARAWPNLTVDESSLRVNIVSLRRALGDGRDGARYVTNVPGRGYCFVASVTRAAALASIEAPTGETKAPAGEDHARRLPPRLPQMVGRDETVRLVSEQIAISRFVTIHGPGGIGKTTVATAIGHALLGRFAGEVYFCDLGSVRDPRLVASAVASTLRLIVQSDDPASLLINLLRDRQALLVLDSCEHVIDATAELAERIFEECTGVRILATSRESLEVEGEHVHRLAPLNSPPPGVALTRSEVLSFPAAHLFVERVAAGGYRMELTDADASIVADICNKLDGIALAIEVAAGRVNAHGLHETATLLDNRLKLLWRGRRTALPRHQTLKATLDWSYDLIADEERTVLRRLSVFVGPFALHAAQAVAADSAIDDFQVAEILSQLVSKSLVSANLRDLTVRYRLLDTTRDYARERLDESGETEPTARRHAIYYRDFLNATNTGLAVGQGERPAELAEHLGNVRAALRWTFSNSVEVELRTELAAAAARYFLELSLLTECGEWSERGLAAMDERTHGSRCEMELQTGLGRSLMFTRGNSGEALTALERALALADQWDDRLNQFRVLVQLHLYHTRRGHFSDLVSIAERAKSVAMAVADPVGIAGAHGILGTAKHFVGNQVEARTLLETALRRHAAIHRINTSHFASHRHPQIVHARVLWLQGFPDQAVRAARGALAQPSVIEDVVTFCIALIWDGAVFRWTGDWTTLNEYSDRLIACASRNSLKPYLAVGQGLRGEALVKSGDTEGGINLLRDAIASMHAHRFETYTTEFEGTLAEGLAAQGRDTEALQTIDDALARIAQHGSVFNMPELLRIRGEILAPIDRTAAEECFSQSIELAERQEALSWLLRTTTSLARLKIQQGLRREAQLILHQFSIASRKDSTPRTSRLRSCCWTRSAAIPSIGSLAAVGAGLEIIRDIAEMSYLFAMFTHRLHRCG